MIIYTNDHKALKMIEIEYGVFHLVHVECIFLDQGLRESIEHEYPNKTPLEIDEIINSITTDRLKIFEVCTKEGGSDVTIYKSNFIVASCELSALSIHKYKFFGDDSI